MFVVFLYFYSNNVFPLIVFLPIAITSPYAFFEISHLEPDTIILEFYSI